MGIPWLKKLDEAGPTIPPEPVSSVLTDRVTGNLYRIAASSGAIVMTLVTSPGSYDTVYGTHDGPMLLQENPVQQVRLFASGGSLVWDDIGFGNGQYQRRDAVVAKDPTTGQVYRLGFPISGAIILSEVK